MNKRLEQGAVARLVQRLSLSYVTACSLVFVLAVGSVLFIGQQRSSMEAEAACSNILSLVLGEVSSTDAAQVDTLAAYFDRPAFASCSLEIKDTQGAVLLGTGVAARALGGDAVQLAGAGETRDGVAVRVEVSYASPGVFTAQTVPWLALALGLVAVVVAVSCRVFVRVAIRPVEQALRQQKEFVAAASHELRSPLSVVKLNLEAARSCLAEGSPQKASSLVEEASAECDSLALLVDDLMALASGDARGWSMEMRRCDAETLFVEALEAMEGKATASGVALVPELPQDPLPPLEADGARVVQMLRILLENAVSYSPKGQPVVMALSCAGACAVFTVTDRGPGVSDEVKARIFERFYQTDAARTDGNHYGLGLSIAREIAEAHGGRIEVQDNEGGGAEFRVWLPLHLVPQ